MNNVQDQAMLADSLISKERSERIVTELSKFVWYIKDSSGREFCFPPAEIIPAEALHFPEDTETEGDVTEEDLKLRMMSFVKKLLEGDKVAWRSLFAQLIELREAHRYMDEFLELSPLGKN